MDLPSITGSDPHVQTVSGTPPTPVLNGMLGGVAQQLGLSVEKVQSSMKQGLSITELAEQHGVSRSSLVSSVQMHIQATRQANGQVPLDQAALDRMVNRALDRNRPGGAITSPLSGYTPSTSSLSPESTGDSGRISILA